MKYCIINVGLKYKLRNIIFITYYRLPLSHALNMITNQFHNFRIYHPNSYSTHSNVLIACDSSARQNTIDGRVDALESLDSLRMGQLQRNDRFNDN